MDSRRKSILKTLSWRIISIVLTFVMCLIFFRDPFVSLFYTGVSHIIKIILYYIHERGWKSYDDDKKKREKVYK